MNSSVSLFVLVVTALLALALGIETLALRDLELRVWELEHPATK